MLVDLATNDDGDESYDMMHVMVMSMKVLTRLKMTYRLISLFPA